MHKKSHEINESRYWSLLTEIKFQKRFFFRIYQIIYVCLDEPYIEILKGIDCRCHHLFAVCVHFFAKVAHIEMRFRLLINHNNIEVKFNFVYDQAILDKVMPIGLR